MPSSLRLESLRDLRLWGTTGELLPRRRKELALLVVLAMRSPRPVRREELQTLFWGERDEEKAQNSLRRALLVLRRTLGDDVLEVQRDDVRVPAGGITLDARDAERLEAEGRVGEAADLLGGVFLPHGESLGAEPFRVWLEGERARLGKLRDRCFDRLVADREAAADWGGMVAAAERWAEMCPHDERAHLRLVEALAMDDRAGEARRHASTFAARKQAESEELSVEWKRAVAVLPRDDADGASAATLADDAAASGGATDAPLSREAAFRRLLQAWREARRGNARVIVLESDTAGGPQELARELARWLAQTQRAVLVLHGRPMQRAGDDEETLSSLLAPLATARGLAGAAPEDLSVLSLYVPALRERFSSLPRDAGTGQNSAAIARVLSVLAEEQPIALVVEDVAAFDPGMRSLVVDIARQSTGAVLSVLATGSAHASEMRTLLNGGSGMYLRVQSGAAASPAVAVLRRSRTRAFAIAALVLAVIGATAPLVLRRLAPATPIVAVAPIDMPATSDSLRPLPLLLETSLGRVAQLRVLSDTRLREVMAQLASAGGATSNARADVLRAAAVAGATEVIEGVLSRPARGGVRLDVRRVDVKTGTTRAAFTVESADPLDLVDLATERIAQDFGGQAPATRFATTSTSLVAYQLFEQGIRAEEADDRTTARRLYLSALADDSTFAMAAYRAARLSDVPEIWTLMSRAARLAAHSPERERLLILANYAATMQDPSGLAYAESLAVRYPAEPDAHVQYGQALVTAGRFAEAAAAFRRAMAVDSLGMRGDAAHCAACDGFSGVLQAQLYVDSAVAAEATAREWLRRQPRSAIAHRALALALKAEGRYDAALDEMRTSAMLGGSSRIPSGALTDIWLRQGRFADVDKDWQDALASGTRDEQADALATAVMSLRFQGRVNEALASAIRLRALDHASAPADPLPPGNAVFQAIVLFELGRYRESGALFDSLAARRDGPSPGRIGRDVAWRLTHAATAYAALGDTARLRQLEDTVRVYGARSSYARDQRLYMYVHGLRLRASGDESGAAEAFRRSLYSPVEGNVRASLELARSLLQLHRAADAVAVLRSALAGPIGASGQYVDRTELHELLGHAYEGAGKPDSALAEYRWVGAAWVHADAGMSARKQMVQRRIEALGAPEARTIPPGASR